MSVAERVNLKWLVLGGAAVWIVVGSVALASPILLPYVALHAVTTGVWAFLMWRADQEAERSSAS